MRASGQEILCHWKQSHVSARMNNDNNNNNNNDNDKDNDNDHDNDNDNDNDNGDNNSGAPCAREARASGAP